MDCKNCDQNYIKQVYEYCIRTSKSIYEGLGKFDRVCMKCGDPRTPLAIFRSMFDCNCNECSKYKRYYRKYMQEHNIE